MYWQDMEIERTYHSFKDKNPSPAGQTRSAIKLHESEGKNSCQ